jgi:hypothetical protein
MHNVYETKSSYCVCVCVCVWHNGKFGMKNNSWRHCDDGSTYACHKSNAIFRKDLNLSSLGSFYCICTLRCSKDSFPLSSKLQIKGVKIS